MSQPVQQQPAPGQQAPPRPANQEPDEQRNLIVNYIPTNVDENALRNIFERCGPIESVKIVCDHDSCQSRGFGFVKYQDAASAQRAIEQLNGFNILNKRLKVSLAAAGQQRNRNNRNNNNNNNYNNQMNPGMAYYGQFGYPQGNPYQQPMMAMQPPYMMPQQVPQQMPQMPPQGR